MSKKKIVLIVAIFACLFVMFSLTVLANDADVFFKILVSDGVTVERSVQAGKIFNITNNDGYRTVTGIKDNVSGFAASKIIEVHIPYGIDEINITDSKNSSITNVIFDDYCNVKVSGIKITGLKTITIDGLESTVTFGKSCPPFASFKEFIVTSPKTTVTFEADSFKNCAKLATFDLGRTGDPELPSVFTFKSHSMQNCGIEELRLDDKYTKYYFEYKTSETASNKVESEGVFSKCTSLKRVYLGEEITSLGTNAFEYCTNLELVYAAGLKKIGKNTFLVNSGSEKNLLKVYNHANDSVALDATAFTGRSVKGVILCALQTDKTSLSNCTYELHYGVPHLYELASDESSCYISYTTDCPCGRIGNAYYKLYASGKAMTTVKYVNGPNPDPSVSHAFTSAHKMEYPNGLESEGVIMRKCSGCGMLDSAERAAAPVLEFLGYSVFEGKAYAMVVGVRFNYETLMQYEELNGVKLDYGIVMASKDALGDNLPITESGNAYSSGVYMHSMASHGLYEGNVKLSNLKETMLDKEFIMAAYIKIGKDILYIQGEGESKVPTSVTYSQLLG